MAETKTIKIGSAGGEPYVAFGDDSRYGDTIGFAYVVVKRTRLNAATRRLATLKKTFKIPPETPLHCRVLFSGDQRQKAGLTHLTPQDVRSIVAHAITIINDYNIQVRYAFDKLTLMQAGLGNSLTFTNHADGSTFDLPVDVNVKAMQGVMMNAAMMLAPDGSQGPVAADCEIFVSADKTKIPFIGKGSQQAHSMYSGFSEIGTPDESVHQLQPHVLRAADHPMLQLADIAAYVCCHAKNDDELNQFHRDQLSRVRNWFNAGPMQLPADIAATAAAPKT